MPYRITIEIEDDSLTGDTCYSDTTGWFVDENLDSLQDIAGNLGELLWKTLNEYNLTEADEDNDEQAY